MATTVTFSNLSDVFVLDAESAASHFLQQLKGYNAQILLGKHGTYTVQKGQSQYGPVYRIGGETLWQSGMGLLYLIARVVNDGEKVTAIFSQPREKAAPLSLGQGMSPQPGMKGNLGGYFSPKEMGIGTVALLGVGGYLLYKAMKKR